MPFTDLTVFENLAQAMQSFGMTMDEATDILSRVMSQPTQISDMEVETTPARRRWIKSGSGKFLTQISSNMHITFLGDPTIDRYYDLPKDMQGTWYYTYCNAQKIVFNGRNCAHRSIVSPNTVARVEMDIWDYYIESTAPLSDEDLPESPKLTKQEKNDIINIEENKTIDTEVNLSTLDFDAFLKENKVDYGY